MLDLFSRAERGTIGRFAWRVMGVFRPKFGGFRAL